GQLGGLLQYVNTFVPTLLGSASQQGDLNRLAQGLADSVNGKLGGPVPLLQYNAGDPTGAALSLRLNPNVTTADLAASRTADPGVPAKRGQIASGSDPADRIGGESYTNFLGGVMRRTSGELSASQDGLDLHKQLLAQAQGLRDQVQGVSLEEEAVSLLEFQRAF